LGAVLFVGLVIVAICIVKKMNNSTQMVHPRGSQIANNQRNNNENNLSTE
jgi:cell division protein FtsL